jgi:isocitrate/isopropylmalate dehydrogenase
MSINVPITVAHGEGIRPEIMEVSLHIIQEAGARIDPEAIEIGEKVYLRGNPSGIQASSGEPPRRSPAFYKAPVTTPQGGGYKIQEAGARIDPKGIEIGGKVYLRGNCSGIEASSYQSCTLFEGQ